MFDRFTDAARHALILANFEASMGGKGSIESHHLLTVLLGETGSLRKFLPHFQSRLKPFCKNWSRSGIQANGLPPLTFRSVQRWC